MIKSEALNLYRNLNKLGHLPGVKFAYAVAKNINTLKPEVQALEKAIEMSKEYNEKIEQPRIKMVEEYANKDDKGKPILNKLTNTYEIAEGKQEALDADFEKLKAENQEVFDARTKQIEDYNELLKSEVNIKLYKVALTDIPNNITTQQMHGIFDMIDEEAEAKK